MGDYIIQKAVNADKVLKKRQRSMDYMAANYEAQRKYDGACAVMFFPKYASPFKPHVESRTGEEYVSLDQVARQIESYLGGEIDSYDGLVLIGEAWHKDYDFSTISGEFRRGKESDWLQFVVNDCLTWDEFNDGFTEIEYVDRIARVAHILPAAADGPGARRFFMATRYAPGAYGPPQALCDALCANPEGYDGLILRDPQGGWTRGSGTTGEIVKLKRVLSYDLRVTGVEIGMGKHRHRVGAIVVDFMGKALRIGTGLSDAQREAWTPRDGKTSAVHGQIAEIEAMDVSSEGLLREPRLKGIRFDKLEPDN